MRELDPLNLAPVTIQTEGKVTGTFGFIGKGTTKVEG